MRERERRRRCASPTPASFSQCETRPVGLLSLFKLLIHLQPWAGGVIHGTLRTLLGKSASASVPLVGECGRPRSRREACQPRGKRSLIRAPRVLASNRRGRQDGASEGAGATAGVVSTASWAGLAGACRVSRARRTSRPLVRPRSAYCRTRATGGSPVARQVAGSLRTHSPAGRLTRPGSSTAVLQQAASPEPRPSATPNPNRNRLIADSFRQQVRHGRC